jgi:capsular exopolysaccharide synthesis family protein
VLRNSLDFINFQHDLKTLIVTSAAPGEGKSTVASNLAAALAQAGKKVVLVSVDFRRPTTDQFFHVNNMIGLSDVLLGTHSLKSALQRPGDEQLLVLTAGKMPPNPSELLGSEKMAEVIKSLGEWGEWVIIDTPPMLAVADPAAVARWADGVLMVTQAAVSTRDAGRKAMELLEKVGARTIGVVVWGLDESRGGGYGYGYGYYASGYYYANYYAQAPSTDATPKKHTGKHAAAENIVDDQSAEWVPHESSGRRIGRIIGAVLKGLAAFVLVVVVLLGALLALSHFLGWGLAGSLHLPGNLRF